MISGFYFFNMSTKQLEIKNYLSEELELLSELLNKGEDTLLVSPTDSGKTRAIITYAKQNLHRRIAILCPTQALVDNLKQDCDIPAGYGKKWAQNTQFFNLLVTTYDSIQFFEDNRFDAIFIDEAHYLAQALLQGIWKRNGKIFEIYTFDNVTDGKKTVAKGILDFVNKTLKFEASQFE